MFNFVSHEVSMCIQSQNQTADVLITSANHELLYLIRIRH
jgi:hypothetical protein